MRPLGPEPVTRPRSTPSSRASLRTPGPACDLANASSSIAGATASGSSQGGGTVSVGPPYSLRGVCPVCGAGAGPGGSSTNGFSGSRCSKGGTRGGRASAAGSSGGAGFSWVAAGFVSSSFTSSRATGVPCETLSPTFTRTSRTTPPAGDGTSIVALSDSSVRSGVSGATSSPGWTRISMTGTSLKSPMSGTRTSMARPPPDSAFPDPSRTSSSPPQPGMRRVPAIGGETFPAQLGEAGDAPQVRGDPEVRLEKFRRRDRLAEDGSGAEQLHLRLGPFTEQVHALEDARLRALGHRRVRVVLVHHGQVVVDVLLRRHHPAQPVLDDHRQLVLEGGIVADAVRDGAGDDVAVAVLVLQAFAVQRRPARGPADQEPARAHVPSGPGEVADALEAEHRIEEVDGDHLRAIGAVRGPGGDPRAERSGLVDPLLQDLPVLGLLVEHQLVGILGPVELADVRVDAVLAEHALHSERAGFVRDDGNYARADALVPQHRSEDADERHGGGQLALAAALELGVEHGERGRWQRFGLAPPARDPSAQLLDALPQPLHLRAVLGRAVEGDLLQIFVLDREVEAVAEGADQVRLHLLRLVGDVLAFHRLAHPEALHRLGEDHARVAAVLGRGLVGGEHLHRIVAAAGERPDLLVGPVGHHRRRLG